MQCTKCLCYRLAEDFKRRKTICERCVRHYYYLYYIQHPVRLRNKAKRYRWLKSIKSPSSSKQKNRDYYKRNHKMIREKRNLSAHMPIPTLRSMLSTKMGMSMGPGSFDNWIASKGFREAWSMWAATGFERKSHPKFISYEFGEAGKVGITLPVITPNHIQIKAWASVFDAYISSYKKTKSIKPTKYLIYKIREVKNGSELL